MKLISFLLLSTLLSLSIEAKQVFTFHYLGDAKPVTIEVPNISNKGGIDTVLESSQIHFNFDQATTLGLNADFNISIEDNKLSIEGRSINKSIINAEIQKVDPKNINVNITFVASEEILAPISNGITEPVIANNQMTFYTGNLANKDLFTLSLRIMKKRFLKSDEVIISRVLTENDYTKEVVTENKNKITIDLKKVTDASFDENKKNEITLKLGLNYNFINTVNLNQIGKTNIERVKVHQLNSK